MTIALIGSDPKNGIIDLVISKTIDAPGETIAFHYGDFDDAYGDGTVADAATNGRVYANTDPEELPKKFGSIADVGTASGQTTYTWTPPNATRPANVLLVAGGGGGGSGDGLEGGGGGGAGGVIYDQDINLSSTNYTISVGQGGGVRRNGVNSSFGASVAIGGGAGGLRADGVNEGADGGSGGGARGAGVARAGGSGTAGQGNDGGIAPHKSGGSGGGGASTVGGNSPGNATLGVAATVQNNKGGNGGQGLFVGVFGETYGENGWFAGGGGGGAYRSAGGGIGGTGGIGGGGNGGSSSSFNGTNGTVHTGGGGGGSLSIDYNTTVAGSGGSGIVAIRYIMDNTLIVSNYVVARSLAVLLDAADTASYSGTGTTWTDISGNGRNGTLQGSVSWVDQGSASYFDFSGANADYINQTAGTSQIYKDMCIVFQHEDGDFNYLLSKSTTVDRSLRIVVDNSILNPGNVGDWAETATTYYVNGVADTDAVAPSQNQWYILGGENKNATLLGSAWNYYLGTGYTQGSRNLNGKIAFLALYTEPLTAAEHIHNYNALKHRFGV